MLTSYLFLLHQALSVICLSLILIDERQRKSVIHCIRRKKYFLLHLEAAVSLSEQFDTKILIRSRNI